MVPVRPFKYPKLWLMNNVVKVQNIVWLTLLKFKLNLDEEQKESHQSSIFETSLHVKRVQVCVSLRCLPPSLCYSFWCGGHLTKLKFSFSLWSAITFVANYLQFCRLVCIPRKWRLHQWSKKNAKKFNFALRPVCEILWPWNRLSRSQKWVTGIFPGR